MKRRTGYRSKRSFLYPFFSFLIFALTVALGFLVKVQVLEIGSSSLRMPVSKGDVFSHKFTHSMYGATVCEKFRVEDGYFTLFHVMTQSDAALEYYAIESRDVGNVNRQYREFTIPAASVGNHVLKLDNREMALATHPGRDGSIRVQLIRVPVAVYFVDHLWR
jgi:hypothetical protein